MNLHVVLPVYHEFIHIIRGNNKSFIHFYNFKEKKNILIDKNTIKHIYIFFHYKNLFFFKASGNFF